MTNSPLNQFNRKDLIRVLDSVRGKKGLVIDASISGPLSLIAEFNVLKHGVEKIYHLTDTPFETECKALVFICRPDIHLMKWIAAHIRSAKLEYYLFFVPKRTLICEKILEEEGVYGDVILGEFYMDLIQLEPDLYSLEMPASFKDLYLEGNPTIINYLAQAIMKLQILTGFTPRILGKGDKAKMLLKSLEKFRLSFLAENSLSEDDIQAPEFDSMVFIDRNVDLVTPMRSQLTYEGLVDELYGIFSTFVELEPGFFAGSQSKSKKVLLNGQDPVFSQIRDQSFEMAGDVLNTIAHKLQSEEGERHMMKTAPQLKEFAAKLGTLQAQRQSLSILYEQILKWAGSPIIDRRWKNEEGIVSRQPDSRFFDYIDDLISMNTELEIVLKLLSLYSLINGGLKSKIYDQVRRDITQVYGYRHVLTFHKLEKCGLLRKSDGTKSNFGTISKGLQLINDYESSTKNEDISYAYAGYAPISVRLLQIATQSLESKASLPKPTWKGYEDVLKSLPGECFEENIMRKGSQKRDEDENPATLVIFIGGCTHAEISAIRALSKITTRRYSIMTTSIINGAKLIKSLY